jgi:hypothetical protein
MPRNNYDQRRARSEARLKELYQAFLADLAADPDWNESRPSPEDLENSIVPPTLTPEETRVAEGVDVHRVVARTLDRIREIGERRLERTEIIRRIREQAFAKWLEATLPRSARRDIAPELGDERVRNEDDECRQTNYGIAVNHE